MTRCHALMAAVLTSIAAAFSFGVVEARGSSSRFEPDVRGCFCYALGSIVSIAMGPLIVKRPTPETINFYLLVEKRYGPSAPAVGEEIQLRSVTSSGPGGLLLLESERRPDEQYVLGVEAGQTLRFLGTPSSGWGEGYTFDEYCVERLDADAVLSFIESVNFDELRCLDEITDVLDIPKPSYLQPDDSGCSGGGFEALTGMALGLGLFARRQEPSTGEGPQP